MNQKTKGSAFAVTIAVIGALWIFLVVVCNLAMDLSWKCWGSILAVVASFGLAEGYLFFRRTPGGQSVEVSALSQIFMILYLLVVLLINTIFVMLGWGDFNWGVLAVNVTMAVGFIVLIIWSGKYTAKVAETITETVQKVGVSKSVSRKVASLMAMATDPEVRKQLLALKELVDLSTNISTNATVDMENKMHFQLDEIAQLLLGQTSKEIILSKINAAQVTWKMRTSIAAAER